MDDIEISSLENNDAYLDSILCDLKDNDELDLIIEVCYELGNNKYLYLASKELDADVEKMIILEQKTICFDNKNYYFYIVENIQG